MRCFRIGNDISIAWDVKKNGKAVELSDKIVSLYMTHSRGREVLLDKVANINGSIVRYTLDGMKQSVLGRYTLTIDIRKLDGSRFLIQDKCNAFELMGRSSLTESEEDYIINL